MSSQGWTSWRSHHSPQPVRKSLARQWRPVLQVLPRRGSFITSQQVIPPLTTGRRSICDLEGRNLYWGCFAECIHCTFVFMQIPHCGLSGRWITGWTGVRVSLGFTPWIQSWDACMDVTCASWTKTPSWPWFLTARREKFSGSIWRTWGKVRWTAAYFTVKTTDSRLDRWCSLHTLIYSHSQLL